MTPSVVYDVTIMPTMAPQFPSTASSDIAKNASNDGIGFPSVVTNSFLSSEAVTYSNGTSTFSATSTTNASEFTSYLPMPSMTTLIFAGITSSIPSSVTSSTEMTSSGMIVRTAIVAILLGAVMLSAVIGNVLVIISVLRFPRLRVRANSFIVSLAFADLLVALLVMPFSASQELWGQWLFSPLACNMFNANDVLFSTASLLHLCCVSLDRYIAITDPFSYETRMSRCKVAVMLLAVWGSSILLSHAPIHMGWYAATPTSPTNFTTTQDISTWSFLSSSPSDDILLLDLNSSQLVHTGSHAQFSIASEDELLQTFISHVTQVLPTIVHGAEDEDARTMPPPAVVDARQRNPVVGPRLVSTGGRAFGEVTTGPVTLEGVTQECTFEVNKVYGIISSIISFWTPAIVMVIAYVKIFREARIQEERIYSLRKASLAAAAASAVNVTGNTGHSGPGEGILRSDTSEPTGWTLSTATTSASLEDTSFITSPPGVGSQNGRAASSSGAGCFPRRLTSSSSVGLASVTNSTSAGTMTSSSGLLSSYSGGGGGGVESEGRGAGALANIGYTQKTPTNERAGRSSMAQTTSHVTHPTNHVKHASNHVTHATQRRRFQRENKAAKTLGIIMGAFLFCWLPFFTWYVARTMCSDGWCGNEDGSTDSLKTPPEVVSTLFWIGYFNSVLNPIIYAFCNRDFRRAFKSLLACRARYTPNVSEALGGHGGTREAGVRPTRGCCCCCVVAGGDGRGLDSALGRSLDDDLQNR